MINAAPRAIANTDTAASSLQVTRLRFELITQTTGELPPWTGALWRSTMGMHLRRQLCLTGLDSCTGCPARAHCDYAYIMETRPREPSQLLAGQPDAPPPYVIRAPGGGQQHAGQSQQLELLLYGNAHSKQAIISRALVRAGETGLGPDSARIRYSIQPQETYSFALDLGAPANREPARSLRVQLHTPLSLRVRNDYLRPQSFTFRPWFTSLLRRLQQLTETHADHQLTVDACTLTQCAESICATTTGLRFERDQRYSARQQRSVNTSGMLGHFDLQGELDCLMPWLLAGQWTHVGKGTVMGMGRYSIEAIP